MKIRAAFCWAPAALLAVLAAPAAADMVYTPVNPSFGGNVFNAQNLMNMATAQNEYKRKADEEAKREAALQQAARAKTQSPTDRFLQQLQSRLRPGDHSHQQRHGNPFDDREFFDRGVDRNRRAQPHDHAVSPASGWVFVGGAHSLPDAPALRQVSRGHE
jgi:hypothetical protein